MLYFSKLRIIFITLFSLLFIAIASSNLFKFDDDFFDKKINLGLDLQGGSYLLLEIDNGPVIEQKLQNLTSTIRNYFKEQNIKINNIKIEGENIFFNVDEQSKQTIIDTFTDENSDINPYYPRFKSHQLNIEDTGLNLKINFSKQGLITLKTSSQDQAIEIVRRRIDEVGTNEPNILKRGNNRILVELPGLDDPMRVKSLLGKTANLTFRFVTSNENDSFGVEKLKYEDGIEEATVSKRIIISGDNLLDAQPKMDTQTNQTIVSFSLDRVGAKRFGKATSTGIGKQLAIVLDGKIISAPVIRDTIASGSGQISGGDHFRTRITHSIEVAQIARSIAKYLNLNEDLTETLSLAHDLGHTPFGHAGEDALDECMESYGGFDHNLQTLRIVMFLENKYFKFKGLNLSIETLEGLLKHNGPVEDTDLVNKLIGLKTFKRKINFKTYPSLEAQISAISDDIAYNNHDIQDGINANLFKLEELMEIDFFKSIYLRYKKKINKKNYKIATYQIIRDSIDLMIRDLLANTQKNLKNLKVKSIKDIAKSDQLIVCFSDKIQNSEKEIRLFLRTKMYDNKLVLRKNQRGKIIIKKLFGTIKLNPRKFLTKDQLTNNKFRAISDFISGMTDRYAINLYNNFK